MRRLPSPTGSSDGNFIVSVVSVLSRVTCEDTISFPSEPVNVTFDSTIKSFAWRTTVSTASFTATLTVCLPSNAKARRHGCRWTVYLSG